MPGQKCKLWIPIESIIGITDRLPKGILTYSSSIEGLFPAWLNDGSLLHQLKADFIVADIKYDFGFKDDRSKITAIVAHLAKDQGHTIYDQNEGLRLTTHSAANSNYHLGRKTSEQKGDEDRIEVAAPLNGWGDLDDFAWQAWQAYQRLGNYPTARDESIIFAASLNTLAEAARYRQR
jgi:hypothetical protein